MPRYDNYYDSDSEENWNDHFDKDDKYDHKYHGNHHRDQTNQNPGPDMKLDGLLHLFNQSWDNVRSTAGTISRNLYSYFLRNHCSASEVLFVTMVLFYKEFRASRRIPSTMLDGLITLVYSLIWTYTSFNWFASLVFHYRTDADKLIPIQRRTYFLPDRHHQWSLLYTVVYMSTYVLGITFASIAILPVLFEWLSICCILTFQERAGQLDDRSFRRSVVNEWKRDIQILRYLFTTIGKELEFFEQLYSHVTPQYLLSCIEPYRLFAVCVVSACSIVPLFLSNGGGSLLNFVMTNARLLLSAILCTNWVSLLTNHTDNNNKLQTSTHGRRLPHESDYTPVIDSYHWSRTWIYCSSWFLFLYKLSNVQYWCNSAVLTCLSMLGWWIGTTIIVCFAGKIIPINKEVPKFPFHKSQMEATPHILHAYLNHIASFIEHNWPELVKYFIAREPHILEVD